MKAYEKVGGSIGLQLDLYLISVLVGGECLAKRLGYFAPREEHVVSIK
jgi:hypothetical protein